MRGSQANWRAYFSTGQPLQSGKTFKARNTLKTLHRSPFQSSHNKTPRHKPQKPNPCGVFLMLKQTLQDKETPEHNQQHTAHRFRLVWLLSFSSKPNQAKRIFLYIDLLIIHYQPIRATKNSKVMYLYCFYAFVPVCVPICVLKSKDILIMHSKDILIVFLLGELFEDICFYQIMLTN